MRRMIPENQQEALRKLTSKEALLGLMTLGGNYGIAAMSITIDSDSLTYVHISGHAMLTEGEDEYFELTNIPKGLNSAGTYVATNNEGGAGCVTVTVSGTTTTTATIKFNPGAVDRTVYFSVLLSKVMLGI